MVSIFIVIISSNSVIIIYLVIDPCPLIGSMDCENLVILAACHYLNTVDGDNVPIPCQEILNGSLNQLILS